MGRACGLLSSETDHSKKAEYSPIFALALAFLESSTLQVAWKCAAEGPLEGALPAPAHGSQACSPRGLPSSSGSKTLQMLGQQT